MEKLGLMKCTQKTPFLNIVYFLCYIDKIINPTHFHTRFSFLFIFFCIKTFSSFSWFGTHESCMFLKMFIHPSGRAQAHEAFSHRISLPTNLVGSEHPPIHDVLEKQHFKVLQKEKLYFFTYFRFSYCVFTVHFLFIVCAIVMFCSYLASLRNFF